MSQPYALKAFLKGRLSLFVKYGHFISGQKIGYIHTSRKPDAWLSSSYYGFNRVKRNTERDLSVVISLYIATNKEKIKLTIISPVHCDAMTCTSARG